MVLILANVFTALLSVRWCVCELGEGVEEAQPSEIVIWDVSFEAVFL